MMHQRNRIPNFQCTVCDPNKLLSCLHVRPRRVIPGKDAHEMSWAETGSVMSQNLTQHFHRHHSRKDAPLSKIWDAMETAGKKKRSALEEVSVKNKFVVGQSNGTARKKPKTLMQSGISLEKSPPLSKEMIDMCKATQANYYVYAHCLVSKLSLTDEHYRRMFQLLAPDYPFVDPKEMSSWVSAEHDAFLESTRTTLQEGFRRFKGNPFLTVSYDAVTLEDGKKYQSLSVTGTVGKTAFALCLCFMDMPDGSMAGQAKEFKRLFKEVTGFDFDQLVIRVVADGGADGVAKELKKDGKHCSMHKFQLVAEEGIGKSGKTEALMGMGPFEEGNELSVHVNDLSTHFSR